MIQGSNFHGMGGVGILRIEIMQDSWSDFHNNSTRVIQLVKWDKVSFPAIKSTGHFFPSPQCLVDQIQVQTSLEVLKVTILGLLRYDIFINNLFLFRYLQFCL